MKPNLLPMKDCCDLIMEVQSRRGSAAAARVVFGYWERESDPVLKRHFAKMASGLMLGPSKGDIERVRKVLREMERAA